MYEVLSKSRKNARRAGAITVGVCGDFSGVLRGIEKFTAADKLALRWGCIAQSMQRTVKGTMKMGPLAQVATPVYTYTKLFATEKAQGKA